MALGQNGAVMAGTWWYLVTMGRYWLVLGGNGSVLGSSGWYLVVLGQYGAELVGTWWYWEYLIFVTGATGGARVNFFWQV